MRYFEQRLSLEEGVHKGRVVSPHWSELCRLEQTRDKKEIVIK